MSEKNAQIQNSFYSRGSIWHTAYIHDYILSEILSFQPVLQSITSDEYDEGFKDSTIDYIKREVYILVCTEEINWSRDGKQNFLSTCLVEVSSVVEGLNLKGEWKDSYGTVLIDNELILNNYDGDATENKYDKNGFCEVFGFATITHNGYVRYTQIIYSFKHKRLMVRDDVYYKLPFKVNLSKDFSGKRAMYRIGSILSLRTTLDVYKKVPKRYYQSDKRICDLSYPRLQLI